VLAATPDACGLTTPGYTIIFAGKRLAERMQAQVGTVKKPE
jgi:hypothetical protein